jgi:hypothetical protein
MGTVVEEDEIPSFVDTVGNSVATQYITPEGGGNYVPVSEPAYDPWTDEQTYVPPAPDAGSTYFESDVGFTEYDGGPAYEPLPTVPSGSEFFGDTGFNADGPGGSENWLPETNYVTNEDYFADLYTGLELPPDAPIPGMSVGMDGSQWFGDAAQQQQQMDWWNSEIDKAIANGDRAKYDALMAEMQQAQQGWTDYDTAMSQWQPQYDAFGQQLGALDASVNEAFAFSPMGEGGFSRTPTGNFLNPSTGSYENTGFALQSDLMSRAYMDQNGTPMVDTPWGPMHYTAAEQRFALEEQKYHDARNAALSGQGRVFDMDRADAMGIFPQLDDWGIQAQQQAQLQQAYTSPGGFSDRAVTQHQFEMMQPGARGYSNSLFSAIGQGLNYTGRALGAVGDTDFLPGMSLGETLGAAWEAYNYAVEKSAQGFSYATETPAYAYARLVGLEADPGRPDRPMAGEGYVDFLRRQYNDQSTFQRMFNETVADPTNVLGVGLIGRGIDAATIGKKSTIIRRSAQEYMDSGLIPEQLVADYIATRPSWRSLNEVDYISNNIARTIAGQTNIEQYDIANQAIAKRLAFEWYLSGQRNGDIASTTQRVIAEISWDVERQFGKKTANQVQRQLTTPQVQQMAVVMANPNAIPMPNGSIVVTNNNTISGIYAPGSGRNLIGTATRAVTPSGLTRRNDGSIVTVSRKTAEDVMDTAQRADIATSDARVLQQPLPAPAATDVPTVASTLPDSVVTDLLPPAPARVAVEPIDATVAQMRWLDAFSQRDGVNYVDEIVAAGDTSRVAVLNKLQEIDQQGLATAAQWHEMTRLGVQPSRRLDMIRMTRQQADAEIARLARTQPRPDTLMTMVQYKQAYPDPAIAPYSDDMVIRALKRSKAHGIDYLRRALDEGWSRTQFHDALNPSNLPATPAQRRTLEAMQQEGKIDKAVDLDSLTTAEADRLMSEARKGVPSPVESMVNYNTSAPLEVIDDVDMAAMQAADEMVAAKKKAQEYFKRHVPHTTNTQYTPAGFKTTIKTQPEVDQGVAVMSPMAERQLAIDLLDSGEFKGSAFEPILEEMSRAIIYVHPNGTLSTGTVSARFEELNRLLIDMVATAEPDETRRLIDAFDNAYGGDRYREITEAAGRRVKNLPPDELARRVDMARRQLPTIEADLANIRRQLNDPSMRSALTRSDADRLRAERAKLEEQRDRALDLTNPKGHAAPPVETAKSKREAARQASSEKMRSVVPNLGERPPVESDQSMAGLMSDHDVADQLVNGRVPTVEQEVVVRATPDEAAQSFLLTAKGNQARNLFAAHGHIGQMRTTAFNKAGTTREAVEAALRVEASQVQSFADMRLELQAFIEDMPDSIVFSRGVDDLPPNIQAMLQHTAAQPFPGESIAQWGQKLDDRLFQLETELTRFDNPNAGFGNFNMRRSTPQEISNRVGNLMSKYRGKPLPKSVKEEIRRLESQLGPDGEFNDIGRLGGPDVAAGGGAGIMLPASRRLMNSMMVMKVPTIEPNVAAWRNADWDAVGPHLDAYADSFYDTTWILDQDKRLRLGGVELNPATLQKSARVALAGDFAAAVLSKYTDEAMRAPDGYAYMRNLLESWVSGGSTDRIFQSSRHGAESLRLIRSAGKDVLDDWDALIPPGDVEDIPKLADRMGTRIAESYAKSIGFNPDDVPDYARTMMWVKAQLTPIWMTTVPAYHLNNIAGNYMAMVIETMRGRGHTNMFRGAVNADYFDNAETGFSYGRWVNMDMSQFTESAVSGAEKNASGRHRPALLALPQGKGKKGVRVLGNTASIIDWTTGGNLGTRWKGLATAGEDFGNTAETFFKKAIYSQEVWGEYPKLWRSELDQMMTNGTLSPKQVDELVMAKGLKEVREAAVKSGADQHLDDLLSRQRSVIFSAEHRAYTIAADAMRDYRMRNKIDGLMDQFLPVHFWATKNMLYVTKAAMDRPALAISAGQSYNAFAAEHKDDPLSIMQGYLKVPAEMIPFLPEGSDYYMRMTQLTNPIFFAVPKLISAMNRDIENKPEDSSFWDMAKHWGKNGMANFWEASGYRLGPQWDWAIKATNRLNQNPDGLDADIMFAANFITSPYTDREGKRRPGSQNVVPFGGWESLLRKLDVTVGGKNISVNDGMKWLNELATGSPYTNYEIAQAALWMKEDTYVNWSEENQLKLETALAAMGSGNYDDPYVQQAMARVFDNSAEGFLRGRIGLHAGKEQTVTNQRVADAWTYYEMVKHQGRKSEMALWSTQYDMPAELRWIARDSGATQTEIDKAMNAAREGKDHPLLKRAREATASEEWAMADQQEFGRMLFGLAAVYDDLVTAYGIDYAWDKMFGTYNSQTGKRDDNGIAPGMEALFMATSPDRMFIEANQNLANRRANATEDMYWNNRMEESHQARPYYDRVAAADEALRTQVAKAGDNMRLVDLAYRSHSNITGKIYDEAKANGIDMGPSGDPPLQGQNYYTRTQEERNFLEWNGALEAVEGRERQQARQGFVLNLVEEQLGVKKYIDGEINPDFVTDGKFDEEKYTAAAEEAAQQAPALFRDIVMDIRGTTNSRIEMGVDGKGITPADFMQHLASENPRLDAWREQRQADRSAFFDMEDGPEKDAERQRLLSEYGEEFLDRTYKDTEDGTTAGDHRRYTEGKDAVANYFYTLSPVDKAAFKERYGSAFDLAQGEAEDGSTYEYNKLFPERLSSEQVAEIVAENGLDTSLVRGDRADRVEQIRGEPDEMQRRLDADLTDQKKDEYYNLATPEDELVLDMYAQLKENPRYQEAQDLKNSSLTKKGFPSWQLAYNKAEAAGDTEMMELIEQQRELGPQVGAIYDKRDEWFNALPDDVKAILIANDPATFGDYASGSGDSAGTTVPASGESSATTTTSASGGGGGSSRPWVDYSKSGSSTYVPRSSSSSYRSSGSGVSSGYSTGSGDQPVLNQILSLDPFLATGEDDGRRAVAIQVSDHVQRIISAFSMFTPDKRMAQFFTGMWMQLIGRMLGPNPDMAAWTTLLARLTKQAQQGQAAPAPQPTPGPRAAMPVQTTAQLGNY